MLSVKLVLPPRETDGGQEQSVEEEETARTCRAMQNEHLHNLYSAPNRSNSYKIKEDEIDRACSKQGRVDRFHKGLRLEMNERDRLEDLSGDGRTSSSGKEPVTSSFKPGNGTLGSIKCRHCIQ